MTGGLMQLVAYGAQDIYLTGNPAITYFKSVYRRHTNFAMESIEQTFNGTINFGNRISAVISRNGDLVSGLFLEITLPHITANDADGGRWTESVAHYIIDNAEIEIGGQLIDRHYGDWLEIWAQLSLEYSKLPAYYEMVGLDGKNGLRSIADNGNVVAPGSRLNSSGYRLLYLPLQFWFCRNIGLALPLIALQYHEVKLNITLASASSLMIRADTTSGSNSLAVKLFADYIYLDTDERRRFAQVSHEYLIEQLQLNTFTYDSGDTTVNANLVFNHPVKELIWVCRQTTATTSKQWNNYTTKIATDTTITDMFIRPGVSIDPDDITNISASLTSYRRTLGHNLTQTAKLQLNGHDRFATMEGVYFNTKQTLDHHTGVPLSPGINVYSFAIKPEDHQPSGTCNFSRIDTARLVITLNTTLGNADDSAIADTSGKLMVFAPNYNVLRIMSGMGGLAYSN